ncbi:hypothetical protein HPL003_23865 [Paenibacillus terrae HPL-003]|uniref:Uncharacterized protein n=1 Tax=Paenibacillus terrae (strain HPL-003) TaxID=985665 RepID=G7VSK1_PAETH|nr:hypothetical protein HPL003_23865 [Paenibacillus terrae HPL-003]
MDHNKPAKASDLRQLVIDRIITSPFLNEFKYLKSKKILKKK